MINSAGIDSSLAFLFKVTNFLDGLFFDQPGAQVGNYLVGRSFEAMISQVTLLLVIMENPSPWKTRGFMFSPLAKSLCEQQNHPSEESVNLSFADASGWLV